MYVCVYVYIYLLICIPIIGCVSIAERVHYISTAADTKIGMLIIKDLDYLYILSAFPLRERICSCGCASAVHSMIFSTVAISYYEQRYRLASSPRTIIDTTAHCLLHRYVT